MNKFNLGNCEHVIDVLPKGAKDGAYVAGEPVVILYNDDDSFYATEYNSWAEINKFISELKVAATEAFGENPDVEVGN